jgi:hypothetical protein
MPPQCEEMKNNTNVTSRHCSKVKVSQQLTNAMVPELYAEGAGCPQEGQVHGPVLSQDPATASAAAAVHWGQSQTSGNYTAPNYKA